jgi:hypothetical protein
MSENINYEDCFIVFLDLLGIKKKVSEFSKKPELIRNLIDTLKINKVFSEAKKKLTSEGMLDIRSWYFSDSFVFLMKSEPTNLPHLFLITRYLQDRLWENGYCLRGAITKGNMYYPKENENILLGQGMIDAYKLESEIAIFPRIVVDEKLFEYINEKNIKSDSFGDNEENLKELIKQDYDGMYFLDLLNKNILRKKGEKVSKSNSTFSIQWESDDESNYESIKSAVSKIISDNLSRNDMNIKQKYNWLKSYLEQC